MAVTLDGRRLEDAFPGAQGRLLFGLLVAERARVLSRDELIDSLWPDGAPAAAGPALRALLSKLRGALGPDRIHGQSELRLVLPAGTWVDLEEALRAVHEAESAVAQEQWRRAWVAAHIARNIAARPFLLGHDTPWIASRRDQLTDVEGRALAALAAAGLGIGGSETALAERAAHALVALLPYREQGHGLLMRALHAQGNRAEAALVYDGLRRMLMDDLGIAPSAPLQALHRDLVIG